MIEFKEIIHYGIHYFVPFIIAFIFFRKHFWKSSLIIILANLIDLDHLLANPIYDPSRCSIGFHPLHSYYAICAYISLFFFPKFRLPAIGLMLHITADIMNCLWI